MRPAQSSPEDEGGGVSDRASAVGAAKGRVGRAEACRIAPRPRACLRAAYSGRLTGCAALDELTSRSAFLLRNGQRGKRRQCIALSLDGRRTQAVVATPFEREVLWWFRSGGGFGMSGSSGSGSW